MEKKEEPKKTPQAPRGNDSTIASPDATAEYASTVSAKPGTMYAAGTIISGQYEVLESLGSGGMGTVLKCTDQPTNRTVAVKILRHELVLDGKAMQRFQREAQAIAALEHPNLVKLHSFHADADAPMLVMEYIDGIPLSKEIENHGALRTERAVEIAIGICDALEYAHSKGIIHRDLKPSNIIINKRPDGSDAIKVVDFGIAKINDAQNKVTATGEIFGSPSYMSPEQALGQVVAEGADQYALGCMLYECLTGSVPFISDNALAVMMHHIREEPPSLKKASLGKEFSRELETTVRRMLAKDPSQRFPSMRAVRDALQGKFDEPARPIISKQSKPHSPFIFALMGSGLTLVILALAAGAWFIWRGEPQAPVSPPHATSVAAEAPVPPVVATSAKAPIVRSEDDDIEVGQLTQFLKANWDKSSLDLSTFRRGLSPQAVLTLSEMPNLQILILEEMHNTKFLNKLKSSSLTELNLAGSDVQDETIRAFDAVPNLRSLNLAGCFKLTDKGFADVGRLKSLRKVVLEHNNIGNDGIRGILKLPFLEELSFNRNTHLTGPWIKLLASRPTLVRLDLAKQDPDGNLSYLQHLHKLKTLSLSATHLTQKDLEDLAKLKTVTNLVINRTNITDAQYLTLLRSLPNLESTVPPAISAETMKESLQLLANRNNDRSKAKR